jgi:hypothetical protein
MQGNHDGLCSRKKDESLRSTRAFIRWRYALDDGNVQGKDRWYNYPKSLFRFDEKKSLFRFDESKREFFHVAWLIADCHQYMFPIERASHFNETLPRLALCHPCECEEIRRLVVWASKVQVKKTISAVRSHLESSNIKVFHPFALSLNRLDL